MYAYDTKPERISFEAWDAVWALYAHEMQDMYEISQELPGYVGKRQERIEAILSKCNVSLPDTHMFVLIVWAHELLDAFPKESLKATPALLNNTTRQIVVCRTW